MHTDTTSQEYLIKLPIGDSFFFLCFINYCISFELSYTRSYAPSWIAQRTFLSPRRKHYGETKRVVEALTTNNYPANFIHNGHQPNRQQEVNDTDPHGMVILPYAKGFSERIAKVLRGFNIKVAHKPIRTISNILKKPKDKIEKEATRGIEYKIKCKDCGCVYIGQTLRALKSRVKEHAKAIAILDENSLLAKHHMLHSHQIDLMSVEIVDKSSAWRQRLILEAWHSVQNMNAINEHIALPKRLQ